MVSASFFDWPGILLLDGAWSKDRGMDSEDESI